MQNRRAARCVVACPRWLDRALGSLQSGVTAGSAKVQCAACAATHALLHGAALLARPGAAAACAPLLRLLVLLVRDCGNFKVRSLAAACLQAVPSKVALGGGAMDALSVLCGALDALELPSSSAAASATASAAAGAGSGGGVLEGPAAGGAASQVAGEAEGGVAAGEGGGEVGGKSFPNFRYLPALVQAVRGALLRLVGLLEPADVARHRDALVRRLPAVCRALEAVALEAAAQRGLQGRPSDGLPAALSPSGSAGGALQGDPVQSSGRATAAAVGGGISLPHDLPGSSTNLSGAAGGAPEEDAAAARRKEVAEAVAHVVLQDAGGEDGASAAAALVRGSVQGLRLIVQAAGSSAGGSGSSGAVLAAAAALLPASA